MLLEQCNSSFISYEFFITTLLFFSSGQIFSILRTWKACQLFLCCLLCLEMDLCYHVLSSFVISCGNYLSSIESYVLLITNCGNAKFSLRHTISKQCYSLRLALGCCKSVTLFIQVAIFATCMKIAWVELFVHLILILYTSPYILKRYQILLKLL